MENRGWSVEIKWSADWGLKIDVNVIQNLLPWLRNLVSTLKTSKWASACGLLNKSSYALVICLSCFLSHPSRYTLISTCIQCSFMYVTWHTKNSIGHISCFYYLLLNAGLRVTCEWTFYGLLIVQKISSKVQAFGRSWYAQQTEVPVSCTQLRNSVTSPVVIITRNFGL